MKEPWDHPDWYDLHDTTWTAGPDREPEHYRETVIALPPLDKHDHLVDVGAGTGKLALLVGRSYPRLGHLTLIEPNPDKLARAETRAREALPACEVRLMRAALGEGHSFPKGEATLATAGSVLMPTMELRGGTLEDGKRWLQAALADVRELLQPGAPFYDAETLAAPWARGGAGDPVRRLNFRELVEEFGRAGFQPVDCAYRFRDRVVLRSERAR